MSEYVSRCHVTGNPVGTDTWREHQTCACYPCQMYLKRALAAAEQRVARLEEGLRKLLPCLLEKSPMMTKQDWDAVNAANALLAEGGR